MDVTATAYNALPGQTSGDPTLTACGTRLKEGERVIAVSRDLFHAGLGCGATVRIDGLRGTYTVQDKMAPRWRKKIDIFMGVDRRAAMEWGKRSVRIHWPSR